MYIALIKYKYYNHYLEGNLSQLIPLLSSAEFPEGHCRFGTPHVLIYKFMLQSI